MRPSAYTNALVRLTPVLSLVGPLVVFGLLYFVAVEPGRSSARTAREQLATLRSDLDRERTLVGRHVPRASEASAKQEFERRTPEGDSASDVADAITSLANGPEVGGVKDFSIEMAAADQAPLDPKIALFEARLAHTPMAVTFDAEYAQIGRFFWNLRTLPSTFELRSVEIAPAVAPLMRVKFVIFVFQRPGSTPPSPLQVATLQKVDLVTAPAWARDPFAAEPEIVNAVALDLPSFPDPVVTSILFSAQRRMARVDGRIVKPGDRLTSGFVRAIDEDGITIVLPTGMTRRLSLERPVLRIIRK